MSGQLKYDVIVNGLTKTIREFKTFKSTVESLQPAMVKNRKGQTELIKAWQGANGAIANATKNQKYFKGALASANAEMRKSTNYLNGFKAGYRVAAKEIQRMNTATKKNIQVSRKSSKAKITESQNTLKLLKRVRSYTKAIRQNTLHQKTWWDSFGRVAVGFGVAYRLIDLVENSVAKLTEAFRGGLTAMDNYISSTATVSGMLALLSSGGGGYKNRFEVFSTIMQDTMKETIRVMPKYKLSMEEISDAYKELAQFGVIITKQDVNKTLIATAAIKEIAVTTGSSSKQIRQEIQGIFNGSLRVTDQFGKFLNKFPEIKEQLYGINKLTTSNAEKWRLATEAISEYGLAIARSNETFGAQSDIIHNTLQILSMDALKLTGIYVKWTKKLKTISESLMTDQGALGSLGKQVVVWFGAGWQVLDKFAQAIVKIFQQTRKNLSPLKEFIDANKELITTYISLAFVLKVVGGAFNGIIKIFKILFSWPMVLAGGAWYLVNALNELGLVTFDSLKDELNDLKSIFASAVDGASSFFDVITTPHLMGDRLDIALAEKFFEPILNVTPAMIIKGTQDELVAYAIEYANVLRTIGQSQSQITIEMNHWYDHAKNLRKLVPKVSKETQRVHEALGKAGVKTGEQMRAFAKQLLAKLTGLTGKDGLTDIKLDWDFNTEEAEAAQKRLAAITGDITFKQEAAFKQIKAVSKDTWQYVSDGFSTYFTSIVSGEIRSFADLWKLTLTTMRDTWAKAMSDMATDALNKFFRKVAVDADASGSGFLATALKSGFSALMGGIGEPADPTSLPSVTTADIGLASGGIISEPVIGFGASGRSYSFAENGPERVLSNSDSFGSSSPTNVTVEIVNKSSQKVKGTQGATRFDMKGMVTQIVLEDLASNGPMARGMA